MEFDEGQGIVVRCVGIDRWIVVVGMSLGRLWSVDAHAGVVRRPVEEAAGPGRE